MGGSELVRVGKKELHFGLNRLGEEGGDVIRVVNVSDGDVAFKVKTTNPMRYVVRPNVGCIARGGEVEIRIFVPDTVHGLEPGASKDRFQLRVAKAPGLADDLVPAEFWREHDDDPGIARLKFVVRFVQFLPVEMKSGSGVNGDEGDGKLPDADELLKDSNAERAVKRATELQETLQQKNMELAKLRTELAETKAETARVMNEAPAQPLAANNIFFSDPFGGVSVSTLAIIVVLFAVLWKLSS